jgi:beta-glucanase (GH16 family)
MISAHKCHSILAAALILLWASPLFADEPQTKYVPGKGDVPQTIVSPLGKDMTLKFNDEFDAVPDKDGQPYIDRSKWQTTFWQGSAERTLISNGETQYYMDKDYAGKNNFPVEKRPNPFSFETPGILTITASKTPQDLWSNYWMGKERCITSGLLCSDRKFTFKYGYVEGRFKFPMQRGTWPAFWMLPDDPSLSKPDPATVPTTAPAPSKHWWTKQDVQAHPWPPEIDIIETMGHWKTRFDTGYIAPKGEKVKVSQWMHDTGADLSADFHTWGLEWDENCMVWTFDGKIIAHGNISPSFRRPFYLLIQLAAGGNWYSQEMKAAKTPHAFWEVDWDSMPWKLECDYVRVYQAAPGTPPAAPFTDDKTPGAGHYNQNGTAPK